MHRRVDRKRLKRRLVDACIKGDTTLLTKRAVDVEGTAVEFDDGSSVRACVVVDACVEIKFTARSNRRVDLHAIDATPARWRGDVGS